MAQQANLQVASRSRHGKGAARSLRRDGKVPGVIYGHGREAEPVAIDTAALEKMLIGISAAHDHPRRGRSTAAPRSRR